MPIRRVITSSAPFEFDIEATLANADMPETDRPQTPLQEKFEWYSQQIRALKIHLREAEIAERRARTHATNKIAEGYQGVCATRGKKYMGLIGELYELGLEQERMIGHLDGEAGLENTTRVYTPLTLYPLPPFHKTHLIAGAVALHDKGAGLELPSSIRDDEYAKKHMQMYMGGVHSLGVR